MTARVYITNRGGHDYTDAQRFGELYYCTDGPIDKLDIQQMNRELSEAMLDSEECDLILLTSLSSLCAVACSIFTYKHGRLNLLIHTKDGYICKNLFFHNNDKENNGNR